MDKKWINDIISKVHRTDYIETFNVIGNLPDDEYFALIEESRKKADDRFSDNVIAACWNHFKRLEKYKSPVSV